MMSSKLCKTCGAWQEQDAKGECRKNAPVIGGWPQTRGVDWCTQWLKDDRPKPTVATEAKKWQIGINYTFIRDYPAHSVTWFRAALAASDSIPEPLRPLLSNVFAALLTDPLPDWIEGRDCCEGLLSWAEQLPCFCNDDTPEGDEDYQGLLMSMKNPAEIAANLEALALIPIDHPLRNGL